jgi:multidrug efflux system outer membrane protein
MKTNYITLSAVSIALLSSCNLYKNVDLPANKYTEWQEAKTQQNKSADEKWWESFSDEKLNQIISISRQNNKDIKIAIARINQARAGQLGVIAENLPVVNSNINTGRNKASTTISSRPFTQKYYNNYRAEFDASWEISLFRIEPAQRAARLNIARANEELNDVLVSLYAEVASNYFEVRKLQLQLSNQSQIVSASEENYKLQKNLFEAGNIDKIELSASQQILNNAKSQQEIYNNQLKEKTYTLEALVGLNPSGLKEILSSSFSHSLPNIEKIASAPTEVLAKRPDVRIALRNLEYSGAMQDVAYSNLLPKISISGLLGFESGRAGSLFNSGSQAWGVSGGLLTPIIDFKKLRADIDTAEADKQEAFAQYEKAMLSAFADVESSFASLTMAENNLDISQAQFKIQQSNKNLIEDKYKQGLSSYSEYLTSKTEKLAAEIELEEAKFEKINQSIRVYKALGGGWNS